MTTNPGAVITLGVTEHGLKLCHKPVMGAFAIACSHEKISISHMRGITVFKKVGFTPLLDPNSNTDYSDYYTPLLTFHTGTCMVHELHAVPSGLLSVNTNFSTIDLIDGQYNFNPIWKPSFISKIIPEDRCHLNGMAVKDKKIKFVSCFGPFDEAGGWRNKEDFHGQIISVETGLPVAENLCLPHSPRIHGTNLYYCEAGLGTLVKTPLSDLTQKEIVCELTGFTRGLDFFENYAVVGLSKSRGSNSLPTLPINAKCAELNAAINLVNLETNELLGAIKFIEGIEEILDVKIIKNTSSVGIGWGYYAMEDTHLSESQVGAFWIADKKSKALNSKN